VIVQLTRSKCDKIPTSKSEIVDRLKEVTYNGCLVREMRAIYFVTKLIDEGKIMPDAGLKRVNIHLIKNEDVFSSLNLSSALNTDLDFLMHLYNAGRDTAKLWISSNYKRVGTHFKMDEAEKYVFSDFVS
jgi:NTE family protein